MKSAVSRMIYRTLLELHPAAFREEFGGEMLWIFDEECKRGNAGYLLSDGIVSLVRQLYNMHRDPGQSSITSGAIITGPGIAPVRFLQAAITALAILFSLIQLLSHSNICAVSVIWADRTPCFTISLQAPSHAEVVLGIKQ
jgi:hypothetical protein